MKKSYLTLHQARAHPANCRPESEGCLRLEVRFAALGLARETDAASGMDQGSPRTKVLL